MAGYVSNARIDAHMVKVTDKHFANCTCLIADVEGLKILADHLYVKIVNKTEQTNADSRNQGKFA